MVTGGGSGIGRAAAYAFAAEGAAVAMLDIDQAAVRETAAGIEKNGGQVLAFTGSIAEVADVERSVAGTISQFGKIDVLFNNAGMEFIAPLLETTLDDWDAVVDTNLRGTFVMSKAVVAHMVRSGGGAIVNNASDAGLRGIKLNAAYSTSKAGIIHLTRSIALDYAPQGVRCNCICPGCIRTPLCERFNAEVGARKGRSGEEVLQEFVVENIPMERVGTAEEVAAAVLFLCSADAAYITGAIIPIDGGLTAGM
jgi:NAD(P)-dependent dehydrogenase (short-subunit alcohol dehydrogenase family)